MKDEVVISSDEVESLAIRTYHRRALEQSLAALEDLTLEQKEFGAPCFPGAREFRSGTETETQSAPS